MELAPYTDADMWLVEALETDPRVMADLGGPRLRDEIPGIHGRRLDHGPNKGWYLKIVPEPGAPPVGAIMIWRSDWDGTAIAEVGWTILFEHQGKGYGSAALAALLDFVRREGGWGDLHAFPGVTNGASNALCRKFGFELIGETDIEYAGRTLRANHWVLRAEG